MLGRWHSDAMMRYLHQQAQPIMKQSAKAMFNDGNYSFLPDETVERAKVGSPIEKAKIAKDATSAWVDVYEYARKIREGEMTWEEVEKADLDTVCSFNSATFYRFKKMLFVGSFLSDLSLHYIYLYSV